MAKLRNVTSEDQWPAVGGPLVKVVPGGIFETDDAIDVYWQTGEQGEEPLWAVVVEAKATAKATKEEK